MAGDIDTQFAAAGPGMKGLDIHVFAMLLEPASIPFWPSKVGVFLGLLLLHVDQNVQRRAISAPRPHQIETNGKRGRLGYYLG